MKQFFDDIKSYSHATVISVCNFPITERKIGLNPSDYFIPKAEFGDIAIADVKDAHFFVYIDESRGSMRSITPAYRLAISIVDDFVQSQLGIDENSKPGIFCVEGAYGKDELRKQFDAEITLARQVHKSWCERLVAIADDSWTTNQKRSAVSDRSRDAARFLKIDRVWLNVAPTAPIIEVKYKTCPACFENVNEKAIVCRSCRVIIDPVAYAKFTKVDDAKPQVA